MYRSGDNNKNRDNKSAPKRSTFNAQCSKRNNSRDVGVNCFRKPFRFS